MKIAVASNNQIKVSGHLGRAKSFLIYEVENSQVISKETRINTFTHHVQPDHHHEEAHHGHIHGEGIHSHSELIEGLKDCSHIIFQSGGWRIIEDLKLNNILPVLTDEEFADTAVEKFIKGTLLQKEEIGCSH